jgi:cytochrome c5
MAALTERLDHGFAVFNCHINDAKERADAEVKAQFGQEVFDERIQPCHDDGIMTILSKEDRACTAWIVLCAAYVNEGVTA